MTLHRLRYYKNKKYSHEIYEIHDVYIKPEKKCTRKLLCTVYENSLTPNIQTNTGLQFLVLRTTRVELYN